MKQYFKKFFGGWLIITLLFGISYFVIKSFGREVTIFQPENLKYIISFYVTVLLWFGLKIKDTRFSQSLREGLLILIFLLVGSIFSSSVGFGGLLGTAVTLLLIALIYVTKIKNPILRNSIGTVFGVIFLLMLVSNFVPIYSQAPDFEGFYATQQDEIIIPGSTNKGNIQVNDKKYIVENIQQRIPYNFDTTGIVIFSVEKEEENVFLKNKMGSIIVIPGQTIVNIGKNENIIEVIYENNTGSVFISKHEKGIFTGNIVHNTDENIFIGKSYIEEYKKERKQYFSDNLGDFFVFEPIIRRVSWVVISILYTIDPLNFGQNVLNYNEYGEILELDDGIYQNNLETDTSEIQKSFWQRIKRSSENTKFKFLNNF